MTDTEFKILRRFQMDATWTLIKCMPGRRGNWGLAIAECITVAIAARMCILGENGKELSFEENLISANKKVGELVERGKDEPEKYEWLANNSGHYSIQTEENYEKYAEAKKMALTDKRWAKRLRKWDLLNRENVKH